jgi:hypothetical protein
MKGYKSHADLLFVFYLYSFLFLLLVHFFFMSIMFYS